MNILLLLSTGVVHKGAVASYSNLTNFPSVGDVYTVLDKNEDYICASINPVEWIPSNLELANSEKIKELEERVKELEKLPILIKNNNN